MDTITGKSGFMLDNLLLVTVVTAGATVVHFGMRKMQGTYFGLIKEVRKDFLLRDTSLVMKRNGTRNTCQQLRVF
jgi:hypothetical protein